MASFTTQLILISSQNGGITPDSTAIPANWTLLDPISYMIFSA